jgi:hypothetical protein
MGDRDPREAALKSLKARRDFQMSLGAHVLVYALLVIIWFVGDPRGFFWPVWPIGGWGLAVALQWWSPYRRGPITEEDIQREMGQGNGGDKGQEESPPFAEQHPDAAGDLQGCPEEGIGPGRPLVEGEVGLWVRHMGIPAVHVGDRPRRSRSQGGHELQSTEHDDQDEARDGHDPGQCGGVHEASS